MSNISRTQFHETDIKQLISRYKQYECLWNYNSIDYRSQSLKQQAWQEIARYFNKDVNEVKRKIKYLRSAYVSEKRKVYLSKKSGSETVHKPSLFYYTEMNFLDNIVILRRCGNEIGNPDVEFETTNNSPDAEDNDDEHQSFVNEEEEIDLKEPNLNCKVETFTDPELDLPLSPQISRSPKIVSARSLSSGPVKRKICEESKAKKCSRQDTSENDRKSQCKALYVSFGKTIALQLQQMSQEAAVLAMSEIHTIITKKTLEHIRSSQESWLCSDTEDSYNEMLEEFDGSS